jgi:hypothetical protein
MLILLLAFFDEFGSYLEKEEDIYTMGYTTINYEATGLKIIAEDNSIINNFKSKAARTWEMS